MNPSPVLYLGAPDVAWTVPLYSREEVDAAGDRLIAATPGSAAELMDFGGVDFALDVLNNWRSAHSYPLNTLQVGLRQKAKKVCEHPLVAQRIKRVPSTLYKLRRMRNLKLSEMQDIGGCRAVLDSVSQVRRLRELYRVSKAKHKLLREDDYISMPKVSGYRGIHLIYNYRGGDPADVYNGLLIEIQLRSRLQHAWATAVEVMGTFLQQALKSSEGDADWLRFFALTSSAFALSENTPMVPRTPATSVEIKARMVRLNDSLQIEEKLRAFGTALSVTKEEMSDAHYFLLKLFTAENRLAITPYRIEQIRKAERDYLKAEKEIARSDEPGQVVLVAASSMRALRSAYPNFWLDTRLFLAAFRRVIAENS